MYDLLIKDGMIVDGTGKMPYCGDVAVKDGKIAECGGSIPAEACRPGGLIRADGRYVSPGFIDIHCHADSVIFRHPDFPAQKLHQKASSLVNAHTQSEMARALADHLTPEETDVYKRGRNARSYTRAKNASMSDYRRATGLEALVGYLYLDGSYDRLVELIHLGLTELSLI